mgnify:CR=1 FL=1
MLGFLINGHSIIHIFMIYGSFVTMLLQASAICCRYWGDINVQLLIDYYVDTLGLAEPVSHTEFFLGTLRNALKMCQTLIRIFELNIKTP